MQSRTDHAQPRFPSHKKEDRSLAVPARQRHIQNSPKEGSIQSGDTILDGFKITDPGVNPTLYIDEYSFTPPQAPVGFTCAGPLPLSEP